MTYSRREAQSRGVSEAILLSLENGSEVTLVGDYQAQLKNLQKYLESLDTPYEIIYGGTEKRPVCTLVRNRGNGGRRSWYGRTSRAIRSLISPSKP